MRSIRIKSAMNNIWNIARRYKAGWLSNHLGFMELIYETEKDKQLAEEEFYMKGFVVIQGATNCIEPELNKKIHRVFSSM